MAVSFWLAFHSSFEYIPWVIYLFLGRPACLSYALLIKNFQNWSQVYYNILEQEENLGKNKCNNEYEKYVKKHQRLFSYHFWFGFDMFFC